MWLLISWLIIRLTDGLVDDSVVAGSFIIWIKASFMCFQGKIANIMVEDRSFSTYYFAWMDFAVWDKDLCLSFPISNWEVNIHSSLGYDGH